MHLPTLIPYLQVIVSNFPEWDLSTIDQETISYAIDSSLLATPIKVVIHHPAICELILLNLNNIPFLCYDEMHVHELLI